MDLTDNLYDNFETTLSVFYYLVCKLHLVQFYECIGHILICWLLL